MENQKQEATEQKNKTPRKESNKESDPDMNIEEELDSPININLIDFNQEIPNDASQEEETKKIQDLPSIKDKKLYEQTTFVYDKYSKRIIYFDVPKKEILIYNRTKTKLLKKLQVAFNFKVLNACVDKKITYLLIFANPNVNNRFIFIYCSLKKILFV